MHFRKISLNARFFFLNEDYNIQKYFEQRFSPHENIMTRVPIRSIVESVFESDHPAGASITRSLLRSEKKTSFVYDQFVQLVFSVIRNCS